MPATDLTTGVLAIPAGATATQTSPDFENPENSGVKVVLDMTSVGTGSVTLEIQGKDYASAKYFAILTGAAVVGNTTTIYTVHPLLTAVGNQRAKAPLPRLWRIVVTANNANPTTYTVGFSYLA